MRLRLQRLTPGQAVWVGTFHRFCSRLLRRHASLVGLDENFTIYDTEDSQRALLEVVQRADLHLTHVTPGQIAQEISRAKSNLVTAEQFTPRPGHPIGVMLQDSLPGLPAAAALLQCGGLRRSAAAHGDTIAGEPRAAANAGRAISLHPGGRVPGHEFRAVRDRPRAVAGLSQPGGHGRSGPVDLWLARCESPEHPRFRAGLSGGPRRSAGAELPQHAADPARGRSV